MKQWPYFLGQTSLETGYSFMPAGWDAGWTAAKAAGSPRIASLADSIGTGNGSTDNNVNNGYFERIVTDLVAVHGRKADFWHNWTGGIAGSPWGAITNQAGAQSLGVFGLNYSTNTAGSVALQTFTTPYACTALDFIYDGSSSLPGDWDYSLDGGARVAVDNPVDDKTHRLSLTGLANTTHTFAWGWQTANASCQAQGCATYVPGATTGLSAARWGGGGVFATAGGGNQSYWGLLNYTSNLTGWPFGYDLVIFECVTNNIISSLSVADMGSAIERVIRANRRISASCSFLFVIPSYPNTATDDCAHAFANPLIATQWHQEIQRLAFKYRAGIIDFHVKWGSTPFGQGFLPTNDIHPTNAGHTDMYDAIKLAVV